MSVCEVCGTPVAPGTQAPDMGTYTVCGDPVACTGRFTAQNLAAMASGGYGPGSPVTGPAPAAAEKPAGDSPAAGTVPLERGMA